MVANNWSSRLGTVFIMKKLLAVIAVIVCTVSLSARAEPRKHKLTPEQKALKKEILEKYDTNKNGKLDRRERASISKEDKERLHQAGLDRKRKKANKQTN